MRLKPRKNGVLRFLDRFDVPSETVSQSGTCA